MSTPTAGRSERPSEAGDLEPDQRAWRARRRRLLDEIDGALERARGGDLGGLDLVGALNKARCELSRDLRDGRPGGPAGLGRWPSTTTTRSPDGASDTGATR